MVTGTVKSQVIVEQEAPVKAEVVVEKPNQFVMIKNAVGSMTVMLESYDFSVPARPIVFKFDQERNYIPVKWAIGAFVTPSALRQMELGYFTFEKIEILIEMAEDLGYYVPDSIKEPKVTLKDIAKALRSGEVVALDKVTAFMSNKTRQDIIATAQKMFGVLNQNTIQYLEKKLKVALAPINLSE